MTIYKIILFYIYHFTVKLVSYRLLKLNIHLKW